MQADGTYFLGCEFDVGGEVPDVDRAGAPLHLRSRLQNPTISMGRVGKNPGQLTGGRSALSQGENEPFTLENLGQAVGKLLGLQVGDTVEIKRDRLDPNRVMIIRIPKRETNDED